MSFVVGELLSCGGGELLSCGGSVPSTGCVGDGISVHGGGAICSAVGECELCCDEPDCRGVSALNLGGGGEFSGDCIASSKCWVSDGKLMADGGGARTGGDVAGAMTGDRCDEAAAIRWRERAT